MAALRVPRIFEHQSALVGTVGRAAAQAGFLLALPGAASSIDAAHILATFSLTAIVIPTVALGSQFVLIREVAAGRSLSRGRVGTYYYGLLLSPLLSWPIALFYKPGGHVMAAVPLMVILLTAYLRLFLDSYCQAVGKYSTLQAGYTAFWTAKAATLFVLIGFDNDLTFAGYAAMELAFSLPWVALTGWLLVRHRVVPGLVAWGEDSAVVIGGLTRAYWLEVDKVVLPLFVSAAVFVDYSVITRVAGGALLLVAAYLAASTPRIVRGSVSVIAEVMAGGRRIVVLAMAAHFAASALTLIIYPGLIRYWGLILLGSLIPLIYLIASTYADWVFYRQGSVQRLVLNTLGAGTATLAIIAAGRANALWMAMAGLVGSYLLVAVVGRRMVRIGATT